MKTNITFENIKGMLMSEPWDTMSCQTQRGVKLFTMSTLAYYLEVGLAEDGETVALVTEGGSYEDTATLESVAVCEAVDSRWIQRVVECVAEANADVDREGLSEYLGCDALLDDDLMMYEIREYGINLPEETEQEIRDILEEYGSNCADEYAQAAFENDPDFLETCRGFMERIQNANSWGSL